MDVVREILLMLIMRKRAAERASKKVDRALVPQLRAAHFDGQCQEAATACEIARAIYHVSRGRAPELEDERQRVVSMSAARDEFVTFSDGYTRYWPEGSPNGGLSAWHLRALADELDRRNRLWDARVNKAFQKQEPMQ